MRPVQNTNPFKSVGDVIIDESMRHGPIMTLLVTAAISIGAAYLVYSYLLSGWVQSNDGSRFGTAPLYK